MPGAHSRQRLCPSRPGRYIYIYNIILYIYVYLNSRVKSFQQEIEGCPKSPYTGGGTQQAEPNRFQCKISMTAVRVLRASTRHALDVRVNPAIGLRRQQPLA